MEGLQETVFHHLCRHLTQHQPLVSSAIYRGKIRDVRLVQGKIRDIWLVKFMG